MRERKKRDRKPEDRRSPEGVRIIRAEEAQAAIDAGQVAERRRGDELRFGDKPPAPEGPRPSHRFPLPDTVDPAQAVPRSPLAPLRRRRVDRPGAGEARHIDPDAAHDPRPWDERTPDVTPPPAGMDPEAPGSDPQVAADAPQAAASDLQPAAENHPDPELPSAAGPVEAIGADETAAYAAPAGLEATGWYEVADQQRLASPGPATYSEPEPFTGYQPTAADHPDRQPLAGDPRSPETWTGPGTWPPPDADFGSSGYGEPGHLDPAVPEADYDQPHFEGVLPSAELAHGAPAGPDSSPELVHGEPSGLSPATAPGDADEALGASTAAPPAEDLSAHAGWEPSSAWREWQPPEEPTPPPELHSVGDPAPAGEPAAAPGTLFPGGDPGGEPTAWPAGPPPFGGDGTIPTAPPYATGVHSQTSGWDDNWGPAAAGDAVWGRPGGSEPDPGAQVDDTDQARPASEATSRAAEEPQGRPQPSPAGSGGHQPSPAGSGGHQPSPAGPSETLGAAAGDDHGEDRDVVAVGEGGAMPASGDGRHETGHDETGHDETGHDVTGNDEDEAGPPSPGIDVSGSHAALPHWTDPPTGEVPRVLSDSDPPSADDLHAWRALGSNATRWRGEDSDWDELDDLDDLGSDESRVGAMDMSRSDHSDIYSFDEAFDRLEEERSGAHRAVPLEAFDEIDEEPFEPEPEPEPVGVGGRGGGAEPAPSSGAPRRVRSAPPRRSGPGGGSGPGVGPSGGGERDVGQAVIVGAALVVVLIIAYAIGPAALLVFGTAIVVAAAIEAYGMLQRAGFRPATLLGLVATAGVMFAGYWKGQGALPLVAAVLFVVAMLWYLLQIVEARPLANVAVTTMTWMWVGLLGSFAALMLRAPHGRGLFLGAVVPTVAADIVAFFVGRQIGHRPLAPHISPGKTVEGLIAGGVAAVVAGAIIGKEVTPWHGIKHGLILGLVIAVVAPIGDLFESMIKRDLSIKDSGRILPGHGGLLDRFDAVLLVLPAAFYLAVAFGIPGLG